MKNFRYLDNVTTLQFEVEKCTGCTMCEAVCPHSVFRVESGKAQLADRDGCMECGACATNCPAGAISVTPGVGCASYIIQTWIKGKDAGHECC